MRVLGLDIGGANLKAACPNGRSRSRPFAMWKYPDRLSAEIRSLAAELLPDADLFAVTMTAELADCFETKAAGVADILAAVQDVAGTRRVLVWLTSGRFASPGESLTEPLLAAASNWHALATWAGRQVPSLPAVLIDIGTTTTDLIPIDRGRPSSTGSTDVTRLLAGELVYTGVRRTPLCAVARAVPFRGALCPLAAELFATTLDVHLWLEQIPEDASDLETANGRPATKRNAYDRLARQLCCDRDEMTLDEVSVVARFLAEQQRAQITAALNQMLAVRSPRSGVIVTGSGAFLARQIVAEHPGLRNAKLMELNYGQFDDCTGATCAYAVAVLAAEHLQARRVDPQSKVDESLCNSQIPATE